MKSDNELLKIGFVFDDSLDSYDGVAQYVKTLGTWLTSQGHHVRYLVGQTKMEEWSGGQVYSLARNKKVSFNANRVSIPLPVSQSRIRQILNRENFDVLHVQVPYSPLMAAQVIKAAKHSTAIIGTFHILPANQLASVGARFLRLMYGRTLRRFDHVFSVSPAAADFARQAFGLRTALLPNVIDLMRYRQLASLGMHSNKQQIVFLGRLVPRKGCQQLLEAFKILHLKNPDVQLIIVGDGPLRKNLQTYVKANALSPFVDFRGKVSESIKPAILASGDIACFPSLAGESFGIVLLEAMASGAKVVLGGDNPGYRSVLVDELALIDPYNTQDFAKRLNKLLSDKKAIESLNQHQQQLIHQYDVATVGQELIKTYRQSIAKRTPIAHNKPHER